MGRVIPAGMPSVNLTELAELRLQTISFFLVALLLVAWAIKFLWNSVARGPAKLPVIGYGAALSATIVWGLLFVLVLTMISGARELLTPGAWKKNGLTYELDEESQQESDSEEAENSAAAISVQQRWVRLQRLKASLWMAAMANGGQFPASESDSPLSASQWVQPGFEDVRYEYRGGQRISGARQPLVLEQPVYDDGRLVLATDGHIEIHSKSSTPELENPNWQYESDARELVE